jgi:hypothetical protein
MHNDVVPWKPGWRFFKVFGSRLYCDIAILLLGVYSKELKVGP